MTSCSQSATEGASEMMEEMADDPTLMDCCRREMVQNRKNAVLLDKLRAVDISSKEANIRSSVWGQEPSDALPAEGDDDDSSLNLTSDEDDAADDPEMRHLRESRMRQLRQDAEKKASLQQSGRGSLREEQEKSLTERLRTEKGYAVVHLAVSGLQVSGVLDEFLDLLATRNQGTLFLRVATKHKSGLRSTWGLPSLPALVCLREGNIIGKAPLHLFCSDTHELHEEEVSSWLTQLRALRALDGELPEGAGGSGDEDGSDEEGEGEGEQPCAECGRTYPHEHVRAVYGRDSSDDESDGD